MKKILSINIGTRGFGREHEIACRELGLLSTVIRSRNCHFELTKDGALLFHKGELLKPEEYAYVFIRVTGKFSLMTSLIAQYFKANNIPLCEDTYLQHTKNKEKITEMLLLSLSGISIPQTVLFTISGFSDNASDILKTVSFPCVLKTNGSQGRNVWKIESKEDLLKHVKNLDVEDEVAMLQEFIPNTYDIRALYMYGDIIGAIKRSSSDGFRNNVSAGGSVEVISLTDEEVELAKKACRVLGRTFAGVDIVRTPKGPYLFEANLGPQIHGFELATRINVAAELLRRIKSDFFQN